MTTTSTAPLPAGAKEAQDLEFKRDLPAGKDRDLKELRTDVVAMANGGGGSIWYGVDEDDAGGPVLSGLSASDAAGDIARLRNSLHDCISPELEGLDVRSHRLDDHRVLLELVIPRQSHGPHALVEAPNRLTFAVRSQNTKAYMSYHAVRRAFERSGAIIRQVRELRLTALQAREHLARAADAQRNLAYSSDPNPAFEGRYQNALMSFDDAIARTRTQIIALEPMISCTDHELCESAARALSYAADRVDEIDRRRTGHAYHVSPSDVDNLWETIERDLSPRLGELELVAERISQRA